MCGSCIPPISIKMKRLFVILFLVINIIVLAFLIYKNTSLKNKINNDEIKMYEFQKVVNFLYINKIDSLQNYFGKDYDIFYANDKTIILKSKKHYIDFYGIQIEIKDNKIYNVFYFKP